MASSSSSPTSSMNYAITEEDLKAFHNIDRTLYARLIMDLGRDHEESMQVVAFWLWLERTGPGYLVNALLPLPDALIDVLSEEAVLCLTCIQNYQFPIPPGAPHSHIPFTRAITTRDLTLRFFQENRPTVIRGVALFMKEVCLRTFDDITKLYMEIQAAAKQRINKNSGANTTNAEYWDGTTRHVAPFAKCYDPQNGVYAKNLDGTSSPHPVVAEMRAALKKEIGDLLNELNIGDDSAGDSQEKKGHVVAAAQENKEEEEEAVDVRTIFLTFSREYPIYEDEVRDFFTGKFGDCIDAIQMQEVPAEEQPLYARMVVRSATDMHVVLEGKPKAKFAINGKHVWARKFVFHDKNRKCYL